MIKKIKKLKDVQDRKKNYVYKGINHKEFKEGNHVFLKVKANKSSLKLGNCSKLVAHYCGSFEIIERIGTVDYILVYMSIHNVLHVSLLKKYIHDVNHIID